MTQSAPVPASVIEALGRYDTPTICNALEIVAPDRRLTGFTIRPLVCPFPDLPPMVGYAKTATIRATHATELDPEAAREQRVAYYEYVSSAPAPGRHSSTAPTWIASRVTACAATWTSTRRGIPSGPRWPPA